MTNYWTEEVIGTKKPIIAMCHFNALPGDPYFDHQGGMKSVIEWARKDFLEAFKQKENWQGVPIGQVVLQYEDGTEAALPLRYGYHVRAVAPDEAFPQAYGALATTVIKAGDQEQVAYLAPLMNPMPDKPVAQVQFVPGTLGAKPLLWGLATRSVWARD